MKKLFSLKNIILSLFAFVVAFSFYMTSCIILHAEENNDMYDMREYELRITGKTGNWYKTVNTRMFSANEVALYKYSADDSDIYFYALIYKGDILSDSTYKVDYYSDEYVINNSKTYSSILICTNFDAWDIVDNPHPGVLFRASDEDFENNVYMSPCMPLFDNYESLSNYFLYGDTSGQLNKKDYSDLKTLDSDFYFIGFKADNYVNSSWQDVSDRTYMTEIDPEYYVGVGFGYAYPDSKDVTDKVWLEEDFDYDPMKLSYDITEAKGKYEDMYLRAVYVVPSYRSPGAGWWHGQPSTIYLKEDGSLEKIINNEKPIISVVSENGVFDSNIPTPHIVTTNEAYECYFSNADDMYYIEIQGRCYTVDDIELYKENTMWKYKYSTILKNNLTSWISPSDVKISRGGHNLCDYAANSFFSLLRIYPIESRSYYGGTNSISNYLFGYDDALSMLKNTLLLNITSAYNGIEIYVRYFTIEEDGSYRYGKWCHWFDNLASSGGSSGSTWDDMQNIYGENQSENGLTDFEKENLESSSDSKIGDRDVISSIVNNSSSLDTTKLFSTLSGLFSELGQLPRLMSTLFGFLPDWLISLIAVSIGLTVIIGVAKAVL